MSIKKKLEFHYYEENGQCEFEEFLESLPESDQAKLLAVISNIEEFGLAIAARMEWVKKIEKNLFEIRSKKGSNIQRALYFHVIDNHHLITHGFTKKQDKTPENEKDHAKLIREKYLRQRRGD